MDAEKFAEALRNLPPLPEYHEGDFEFVRDLGIGRFSKVTLERYHPSNILCAVKAVNHYGTERGDQSDTPLDKDLDCTTYLAEYPHENLVATLGVCFSQMEVKIILEYMNAGSVASLLEAHMNRKHSPLPEEVLAVISRHALEGLAHLHGLEFKIVHRDIKPDNILLSINRSPESGKYTVTAKIADFNTSRLNTNNQQLSFVGTQIFMSPERIIGLPHGVPADIFSLGLTIWMAAEGQHPIEKHCRCKNVQAVLLQIAKPVAPIVPSTFSQAFREFISSCLDPVPEKRKSASELLEFEFIRNAPSAEWLAEWILDNELIEMDLLLRE